MAGGASKIYLMARSHGMNCRRLTWNPNYKGIDDWQLSIKKKEQKKKEDRRKNFRERFLLGLCGIDALDDDVEKWHSAPENGVSLAAFLGLSSEEYALMVQDNTALERHLLSLQRKQRFRIYQLEFTDDAQTRPYAFRDIAALHKAGYEQPPAADYRLVEDSVLNYTGDSSKQMVLEHIFERYNDDLPPGYAGRCLSPSDVVELYDNEKRRYFYRNQKDFTEVRFSPKFALPMKSGGR